MARYEITSGASEVRLRAQTSLRPLTLVATDLGGFIDAEFGPDGSICGECACRVQLRIESLHSGNAALDRQGARHFDAEQYPVVSAELNSLASSGADVCDAVWRLTFHGVTRDVHGPVTLARIDERAVSLDGGQVLDVREWGVRLPSLPLVHVHPDVHFAVRLVAHRVEAARRAAPRPEGLGGAARTVEVGRTRPPGVA